MVGLHKSTSGRIHFDGKDISRLPAEARARAGIGYVPQGRGIFPHLTVEENLFVGAVAQGKKPKRTLERVFALFPILKEFLPRKGGMLSGGQQQQLAIGRALLTEPKVLILDEPTEGIQPNIIDQIGEAIKLLRRGGHHNEAMLLAEAAQSLKKLKEEGNYPKPELLETLGRADQSAAARRRSSGSECLSTSQRHLCGTCARRDRMKELCSRTRSPRRSACSMPRASMTILLVEQYLDFCKELADNFAILDRGSVVARGSVAELTDEVVKEHLTV